MADTGGHGVDKYLKNNFQRDNGGRGIWGRPGRRQGQDHDRQQNEEDSAPGGHGSCRGGDECPLPSRGPHAAAFRTPRVARRVREGG